jgi:AmmeMemoRadiSam system protein B
MNPSSPEDRDGREYPKLRPIEVVPMEQEGKRFLLLRNPEQLLPLGLSVSPALLPILQLLDGEHSILDLQAALTRATGSLARREQVEEILARLDEALLLDSDHYRGERARIEQEFRDAPVREATHAGAAYPEEAGAYRQEMERHLEGIDAPPGAAGTTGVISPHIDYGRGAATYAAAFAGVDPGRFRRVVVLGTSHYGAELFSVTNKAFATPFGTLPADVDFLQDLTRRYPGDLRAGELLHKQEHSIELNAAYLHFLCGESGIALVPILCGSFHELVESGRSPAEDDRVSGFLDAMREALEAAPGETLLVAAADLAHVGPRFGDRSPLDAAALGAVEREDRASMERAAEGDAEGFYRSVETDKDRRNICGLPPIYALLSLLPGAEGTLLDYRQCPDPDPGSFVSIAAMQLAGPRES